jgi:hypothetical protein
VIFLALIKIPKCRYFWDILYINMYHKRDKDQLFMRVTARLSNKNEITCLLLPSSQEPNNRPCRESDESTSHPPTLFIHDPHSHYSPIYVYIRVVQVFLPSDQG